MYTAPIIFNKRLKVQFFFYKKIFIDKERYRVPQYIIESIKKCEQERLYFLGIENLEIEDENIKIDNLENKVLIENLLNCCTKKERQVLALLFFKGYSGDEIAKKFRMSRQWVHSMKLKAFEKIRENINFVINKKTSIMRNK